MNLILFYLSIFFFIPLIYFLRKKKQLLSFTGDKHQNYLNKAQFSVY